MNNLKYLLVICMIPLLLIGCAGGLRNMRLVEDPNVSYKPATDQAVVVFMRPSGLAYKIQSSVFDTYSEQNKLVGLVPSKHKVAYVTSPGDHLFMVIGETADFMRAHLEAGKTYYALVTPRMGAWKARFSLAPMHKTQLVSNEFKEWVKSCKFIEKIAESDVWAQNNARSIEAKQKSAFKVWSARPENERSTLQKDDGM